MRRTAILLALLTGFGTSTLAADYYVSPTGKDTHSVSSRRPFKTIEAARDHVRKLVARGLRSDVTVHLREGTYTLNNTLLFDSRDSGTEKHAITYQAYRDEKVIVSGGRTLTGTWVQHEGNIWKLDLPDVKAGKVWFRQLFMEQNGRIIRATRARWPNLGKHMARTRRANNKARNYETWQTFPVDVKTSDNAECQIFTSWVSSRARVLEASGKSFSTETVPGNPHSATIAKKNQNIFFEHAYGFIDIPGEWYLDKTSGTLFIMMNKGNDPNKLTFHADRLNKLVQVTGTLEKPVTNLHFKKLNFRYSFWDLPKIGFGDMWTGNYGTLKKGINWVRHVPLAIECEYARNCGFERCEVAHMGGSGIGFGRGVRNSRIMGCLVHDISAIGINIGWRTNASTDDGWVPYDRVLKTNVAKAWGGEDHVPGDNSVTDNWVRRPGQIYQGCAGIFMAFNRNFNISHNDVSDTPYGCIVHQHYVGERTKCISAYNHVHYAMRLLGDGGGIYTSVTDTGGHIHHNYVHDILRFPGSIHWANVGIYLDDMCNNCLVENNSLYNIINYEIQLHRGNGHTIRSNRGVKKVHFAALAFPKKNTIPDMEGQAVELTEAERREVMSKVGPREPYRSWLTAHDPDTPIAPAGMVWAKPVKATASSQGGQHAPKLAIDPYPATRWASKSSDSEWLMLELEKAMPIAGVELLWEAAYGTAYEIQVSRDGKEWKTVFTETEGDGDADVCTFAPQEGRFVRMMGKKRKTKWGFSLFTFHAFAQYK
jgi:hypothetical protein